MSITVDPVNDAPVNTVPTSIIVTENNPTKLTGISVSDVDSGASATTMTLSVAPGNGTLAEPAEVVSGQAAADELTGTNGYNRRHQRIHR